MFNTIQMIFKIKTAMYANTFIYYLKRLWFVGKFFPESLYANESAKNIISIFVSVAVQIWKLTAKFLYLGLLIWLPIFLTAQETPFTLYQQLTLSMYILFFLSCIIAPLSDSEIFKVTRQKFVGIRYMKMNAQRYTRAALLMRYVLHFLWYFPALLVFTLLLGGSYQQALMIWGVLIAFRFIGEALHVWVYAKSEVVFSRLNWFIWPVILIALTLAYLPLLLHGLQSTVQQISSYLYSLPALLLFFCLGALSIYYVGWGYKHYQEIIPRSLDSNMIFSVAMEKAKQSFFTDVAVKETDLKEFDPNIDKGNQFAVLNGYAYLNAIFFYRHRRQLLKPVFTRIAIIIGIFIIGTVFHLLQPELFADASLKIINLLPVFVFIMYFMSVADKACRAMFYNCDISLLRYSFYRRQETILQNFNVRLLRIALYNLAIAAAICMAVIGFYIISGNDWLNWDMGMFVLTIFVLSLFFSVHHLFMYYVFQPYTTELNVSNPFFKVINSIVYFLCFISLQIRTTSSIFALIVLSLTVAYIAIALILVYKYAPRYFRVK